MFVLFCLCYTFSLVICGICDFLHVVHSHNDLNMTLSSRRIEHYCIAYKYLRNQYQVYFISQFSGKHSQIFIMSLEQVSNILHINVVFTDGF